MSSIDNISNAKISLQMITNFGLLGTDWTKRWVSCWQTQEKQKLLIKQKTNLFKGADSLRGHRK